LPINHEDPATGNPKLGKVAWEKAHKITNMLGYELVEEKNLPAGTTTCTFDGLDGDVDKEYLIEGRGSLALATTSGDSVMSMYPNNDTGANYLGAQLFGSSTPACSGSDITTMRLCRTILSTNSTVMFSQELYAITGIPRTSIGKSFAYNSAGRLIINFGCAWTNINDNITSLTISIANGSYSGILRLWKRIPVEV
jgi:hypothetical protein